MSLSELPIILSKLKYKPGWKFSLDMPGLDDLGPEKNNPELLSKLLDYRTNDFRYVISFEEPYFVALKIEAEIPVPQGLLPEVLGPYASPTPLYIKHASAIPSSFAYMDQHPPWDFWIFQEIMRVERYVTEYMLEIDGKRPFYKESKNEVGSS